MNIYSLSIHSRHPHPAAKRAPAGATLSNIMQTQNTSQGRARINHPLEEEHTKRIEKTHVTRRGPKHSAK